MTAPNAVTLVNSAPSTDRARLKLSNLIPNLIQNESGRDSHPAPARKRLECLVAGERVELST